MPNPTADTESGLQRAGIRKSRDSRLLLPPFVLPSYRYIATCKNLSSPLDSLGEANVAS